MILFDEIDIQILKENFDNELIEQINYENVEKILDYLEKNGIYYKKDLFLTFLDLFLLDSDVFITKFEKLKRELGNNYINRLGEDLSLIEIMYKD